MGANSGCQSARKLGRCSLAGASAATASPRVDAVGGRLDARLVLSGRSIMAAVPSYEAGFKEQSNACGLQARAINRLMSLQLSVQTFLAPAVSKWDSRSPSRQDSPK